MSETLTLVVRADATIDKAFSALTDRAALTQWLSEFADVELPNRYRFWGRFIPDGDEPRQTLSSATDRSIRFRWDLDNTATDVSIALEPLDALATSIQVTQSGFDPASEGPLGQLQTFWALALANLVDLLEEREVTPRADLTSNELSAEVMIAAPVDAVFESLVSSEKVSAWFGAPLEIEPREGGRFGYGRIVEFAPERRMSVDFAGMGTVTWELEGSGGRTRLTISQSGFDPDRPPYAAWMGVLSGIAELRRFHELPDWRPLWPFEEASPS
ncbi:SRPBCC domain-containing protein [Agromyces sp. CFH 90414]|uniref:SRPBCC domain-containing protein n=1 Tax=Agromyces agglutinans TaxID=2662258 RepID=A0A6I2F8S9_9MICO|nr:SRPBCC domain-containing protein [Agromyces agglutinans]MRG58403.1 SRPBCC domain-containing protein [Agromyces agglutinans]